MKKAQPGPWKQKMGSDSVRLDWGVIPLTIAG